MRCISLIVLVLLASCEKQAVMQEQPPVYVSVDAAFIAARAAIIRKRILLPPEPNDKELFTINGKSVGAPEPLTAIDDWIARQAIPFRDANARLDRMLGMMQFEIKDRATAIKRIALVTQLSEKDVADHFDDAVVLAKLMAMPPEGSAIYRSDLPRTPR